MTDPTPARPTGPTFGEILESFRRRRGMRRRPIARQLGISSGQIKDWERGVEIPMHPGLLRSLETVLETPEGLLTRAAGLAAPLPQEPPMTVHQSLQSLSEPVEGPTVHPLDVLPEPTREWVTAPGSDADAGPAGFFSYRYNLPEERWVYRIRFLLTGAGMALLGLLMLWAVRRVWEELGSLWNAIFG